MMILSYCVVPSDSNWYWELKAPDRSVVACGVAPTDLAARVAAIRAASDAIEGGEPTSQNKH
jgi:hypothetical protein